MPPQCASCSTRALELFLRDFSGLNLSTHVPPVSRLTIHHRSRLFPGNTWRSFNTQHNLRKPQQSITSIKDAKQEFLDEETSSAFFPVAGTRQGQTSQTTTNKTAESTMAETKALQARARKRKEKKLQRQRDNTFKPLHKAAARARIEATRSLLTHAPLSASSSSPPPPPSSSSSSSATTTGLASAAPSPSSNPLPTASSPLPLTLPPKAAARRDPNPNNNNNNRSHSGKEAWQVQKAALASKFSQWQPRKRLSPDTLAGIRALHAADPAAYATPVLAAHFAVTPEAIRRILKGRWQPSADEAEARRLRWERRSERSWAALAAQGVRPPRRWRARGIGVEGGGDEDGGGVAGR